MTISQDIVSRALTTYCVENIWNEPAYEGSVTLQLYPTGSRFMTNSLILGRNALPLPIPGMQFAVFWAEYKLMEDGLIIPPNTWISTDQLGQTYQTLFHVYSETGVMIPKAAVFIYHNVNRRKVFIAIKKNPIILTAGLQNWNQLYMAIYRYNQPGLKPLTVASYQVATPDPGRVSAGAITTSIVNALARAPLGTFVYVNGYDRPASPSIVLHPGDYVDVYTDTTVIGKYSVNLTTTATGYLSTKYQTYKEVIHCPKAINPNKLIATTELLTMTVRRNSDHIGCFLHRNEKNGVTQITHVDVGVDTDIINAYRQSLNHQDVSIEVRLRAHTNTLIREINYIDYLYLCDDATILTFLIGHGDPSLPFWTAAALEQSAYVGYMTDSSTLLGNESLASYISGLGYYAVMAAICQHDKNFIINQTPVNGISVKKPLILSGMPAYPLVYLDGIKLSDTQVDYANTCHDNIIFSLTSTVYATIGQTLTVELIEAGPSIPYLFTPVLGAATLTVPFNDVAIYQSNVLGTPVRGYLVQSSTSYIQITPGPGAIVQTAAATGGGTTLTFQPGAYTETYLIQNTSFSRAYGLDISSQVSAIAPIHIELTTLCTDGTTVVPLLGYQTLSVYLNGRRMIEGIDYAANPLTDVSGNPSIIQLMLCNRSKLSLTGTNYLEVIAHTSQTINKTVGYVANNTINIKNNVEAWYSGLSTAFANGLLLINPTDVGDAIVPTVTVGNGIPFVVVSEVPGFAENVLTGFSSSADDNRISLINTYFNEQAPFNDISSLIIPASWEVFSPYLTAICHDASQAGQVTIFATDPDPVLFQEQFSSYNYLLANDPTLTASISAIDLRYCDIFPCYAVVNVPDLGTYTAVQRLASLLLPPDSDTLGEVLND